MTEPVTVHLTWSEALQASIVGVMRHVSALKLERRDAYGASSNWNMHIEGACAEKAVAKYLGRYWSGTVGQIDQPDVGPYQVRQSCQHHHKLILHPEDKTREVWILVTGQAPRFVLRGWCFGHEAKRDDYWADPTGTNRPAYFAPQSILHDMGELLTRTLEDVT